ncbi:MAG: hypothetical protein ABIO70_04495 [Pseudomonadota bacterium]
MCGIPAEALRAQYGSRWLPGFHAEAVLLAARPGLGPTRGVVEVTRALAVLDAVEDLGWHAPPPHPGAREVPEAVLARFVELRPSC